MKIRIPALLAVVLSSCQAAAVMGTPDEIKTIPVQQAVMLESAIESIEGNSADWTNADGSVKRAAILDVLRADKAAWDQLDRYYNEQPGGVVSVPTNSTPTPAVVAVTAADQGGSR
jgi:hypothetical protein